MIRRPADRRRLIAGVLALGLVAPGLAGDSVAPQAVSLETLLRRTARAAMLFRDTALHFACRETISWKGIGMDPGTEGFEYVFVHDEAKGFRDYRTPTFLGARRRAPREVQPEEYGVPSYLRSAYLWIFTFRLSRQNLHDYRILGVEKVLGVEAVKVEFHPVPPIRTKVNDWFGVAWVDPELGQLLKVVAYRPEDYRAREGLEAYTAAGQVDDVMVEYQTLTTMFTEQRNGMRFPGVVTLDHSRYRLGASKGRKLMEVEQRYRNYEFFSVRTEAEVRSFILEGGELKVQP